MSAEITEAGADHCLSRQQGHNLGPGLGALQQDFHQHDGEKDGEGIVGAGFHLDGGADAGPQPQTARMHEKEDGGGVGRGHHRADQQALGPGEVECINGDRRHDR